MTGPATPPRVPVEVEVNGRVHAAEVEPRLLLADFIRDVAGLTGTHLGCEHGACGACTVQVDGVPVRACLMLAVQAAGRSVRTVEDLAGPDGALHPLQRAFHEQHGLQCGFCTPGFLMALEPVVRDGTATDEAAVRAAIGGNLCRCTGYQNIVAAVQQATAWAHGTDGDDEGNAREADQ